MCDLIFDLHKGWMSFFTVCDLGEAAAINISGSVSCEVGEVDVYHCSSPLQIKVLSNRKSSPFVRFDYYDDTRFTVFLTVADVRCSP